MLGSLAAFPPGLRFLAERCSASRTFIPPFRISRAAASGSGAPIKVRAWPAVSFPSRTIALTAFGRLSRRMVLATWRPALADIAGHLLLGVGRSGPSTPDRRSPLRSALRSARWTFSMMASSSASPSPSSRTITGTSCSLASWAARQRRSPATISKAWVAGDRPHQDRLQDALLLHRGARSFRSSSAKRLRGWKRLGLRNAVGTLRGARSRASPRVGTASSPIRADRPRPKSARTQFFCQAFGLRAHAAARIRSRWMSSPASLI